MYAVLFVASVMFMALVGSVFHELLHAWEARSVGGEAEINWRTLDTHYHVPSEHERATRTAPIRYAGVGAVGTAFVFLVIGVSGTIAAFGLLPWLVCATFGIPGDLRMPERVESE